MTFGYLRVSRADQDVEKFKADVLKFADYKGLGKVSFIEEKISGRKHWQDRELGQLVDSMREGDVLIAPEMSRLGRSMSQLHQIIAACREKGIVLYCVKENLEATDDSVAAATLTGVLAMMAEVETRIISARTTEALAARRAAGVRLGRTPIAEGGKMSSKLDEHTDAIKALLGNGSTLEFVCNYYGIHRSTLRDWMARRNIDRQQLMEQTLSNLKRKTIPTPEP